MKSGLGNTWPLPHSVQETCRTPAWQPTAPPRRLWHCSWTRSAVNCFPGGSRSALSSLATSRQVRVRFGVGHATSEDPVWLGL